MSTTITALGTVPQKILDIGPALTTSFVTQVEFDTHGAEYLGFQYIYTKGGETNVSLSYEAKLRSTGEYVALPSTLTAIQSVDAANATRAFQLYVGRDVSSLRIRAKTTGAANGTTHVEIWAMLSAPTFPIIGSAY